MKSHLLTGLALLLFSVTLFGDDRGKLKEVLNEVEGADQVLVSGVFSGPGEYEGAVVLHAYGEGGAAKRIYEELQKLPWRQLDGNPFGGERISTNIGFDVIFGKGKQQVSLSFIGPNVFRARANGRQFWFDVAVDDAVFARVLVGLLLEDDDKKGIGWKLVHRRPYD